MPVVPPRKILLDYRDGLDIAVLENLSGIAATGDVVWTVADEGRSLECLARDGDGFRFARQVALDDVIAGIPGRDKQTEMDLESIDIADGVLWLCGSHCRTRRKGGDSEVRDRPSRQVLAALDLSADGRDIVGARALPFDGAGSLRARLRADAELAPYLDLPTKENGLDIEGLAVFEGAVLLGLRGPVIGALANVVRLQLSAGLAIASTERLTLDLGGLGVRDLARAGDAVIVLAGPVDEAPGPFRLYGWRPAAAGPAQSVTLVHAWPSSITEKPEGLCAFSLHGRDGLVVIYDSPDSALRRQGTRYLADWVPLQPL